MDYAQNFYLVFIKDFDGDEYFHVMTADQIFDRMDIADCTDEEITAIYLIREGKKRKLQRVQFHGVWHDLRNPLCMTITTNKGQTLDYGWGTDH